MPKTDWQALDARMAREVLNCVKWDELTDEEQDAVKRWRVWRHYDGYWWQRGEGTPRLMCGTLLWQPCKDVAQALLAADALMSKFLDVRYVLEYTRSGYWCILRNLPAIGSHHTNQAATLAKAICLALEKWLDAQKELQDDPR